MRVAIIGFGFSGLLATAHLVRRAPAGTVLYIIDETADGRGTAYSTTNPEHLLNVPAANMSAFAEEPDHLVAWLATQQAAAAKAMLGLKRDYTAQDFIPRALYGAYLQAIWRSTQEIAAQQTCEIKLVPTRAVAVQQGAEPAILTERGDAIAVDKVILAVGHEGKVILPEVKSDRMIQNPWRDDALGDAKNWASPVLLMGTGLTAIDMLLSLRREGYTGEIIMASYRGLIPQSHASQSKKFQFSEEEIAAATTLQAMEQLVRKTIEEQDDWRAVIDALRPYTQAMWQRLKTHEQQHFLHYFMPQWNVHRHRMAPEIAAVVEREMDAARLRVIEIKTLKVDASEAALNVTTQSEQFAASHILNCTGLELNPMRTGNSLLKQLLAEGAVETHATQLGIVADKHHRAWGNLYPNLFVIGSLLTGQLLESTAVPELRVQAMDIARSLT